MVDYNPVSKFEPDPNNFPSPEGAERRVDDRDDSPGITVEDSDRFTSGNRPSALDDPRLQNLIREQKRARESGDLLDLMKIAGMTGRSSGLTRQDLIDAGLLDSPAESRAKRKKAELEALQELRDMREEYNRKGKERLEERKKQAQEKRDAKKDRLIQRMTDAGVSEEDIEKYRSGGQTSTFAVRRLQEARAKKRGEAAQATKATPAKDEPIDVAAENQMLMDDLLNFGPVPPDPKQPTKGMGFDEMSDMVDFLRDRTAKTLEESKRRSASRNEQIDMDLAARKREIEDDFALGMEYDEYIAGEGPGSFIGDYKNSPAYKQYEREMLEHQRKIRAGEFGSRDPVGGPSEFTLEQRERAMERARPKPPPVPAAPSFEEFKAGKAATAADVESIPSRSLPSTASDGLTPSQRLSQRMTTREEAERGMSRVAGGAVGSAPTFGVDTGGTDFRLGRPRDPRAGFAMQPGSSGGFVPTDAARAALRSGGSPIEISELESNLKQEVDELKRRDRVTKLINQREALMKQHGFMSTAPFTPGGGR